MTTAVGDEIDQLVDWQLANPRPGAMYRRLMFHMTDDTSLWTSAATWSPENGWGHRCPSERPAQRPDYWGPDPV